MIIRNIVSIDLSLSFLFQNKRYWREFRNYYHLKIQIKKMHRFTIIFKVELNVRYSVNMDYEYISMRINCVIIGTLKIKREMTSKTIEKCPWFLFNFHESTIQMKMIFSFLHYLYCNKRIVPFYCMARLLLKSQWKRLRHWLVVNLYFALFNIHPLKSLCLYHAFLRCFTFVASSIFLWCFLIFFLDFYIFWKTD